jgi:LPXTG-motif cell wall-anchored protein
MRKLFASLMGIAIVGALVAMIHPVAYAQGGADKQVMMAPKGSEEVPNPGDPDGAGTATATFKPGSGEICWDLKVSNIALPSVGAHIHEGKQGTAGPIVVPFSPPDANGVANGCTKPDAALMARIMQNPENFYLNIHSSEFPAGAIRSQLMTLTNVGAATLPDTGTESGMPRALALGALLVVAAGLSLRIGGRRRTMAR